MSLTVRDIMSVHPTCVSEGDTVEKAAMLMREEDCGLIPVVKDEAARILVGVITDRDIVIRLVAQSQNPVGVRVNEAMTAPVHTLPLSATADECARLMQRERVRRVPIVDENGKCIGIVAQADLALELREHAVVSETVEAISQP